LDSSFYTLDSSFCPLDNTFYPLDNTFYPLYITFYPLDKTSDPRGNRKNVVRNLFTGSLIQADDNKLAKHAATRK
jgi:hypothetical protein